MMLAAISIFGLLSLTAAVFGQSITILEPKEGDVILPGKEQIIIFKGEGIADGQLVDFKLMDTENDETGSVMTIARKVPVQDGKGSFKLPKQFPFLGQAQIAAHLSGNDQVFFGGKFKVDGFKVPIKEEGSSDDGLITGHDLKPTQTTLAPSTVTTPTDSLTTLQTSTIKPTPTTTPTVISTASTTLTTSTRTNSITTTKVESAASPVAINYASVLSAMIFAIFLTF